LERRWDGSCQLAASYHLSKLSCELVGAGS
jgi:hypothetical protein